MDLNSVWPLPVGPLPITGAAGVQVYSDGAVADARLAATLPQGMTGLAGAFAPSPIRRRGSAA